MTKRISLIKALLSIPLVLAVYYALNQLIGRSLAGVEAGGYLIAWSVFASAIVMSGAMAYAVFSGKGLGSLGFKRPRRIWLAVLIGVVAPVPLYLAAALLAQMLAGYGLAPPAGAAAGLAFGPSAEIALALSLALMWFNAALGEEVIFRGLLMNNLQRALGDGVLAGVVASAVVAVGFGLMHVPSLGWYGFFITGLLGFLLGLVFLIGRRNLLPVVIAHGLINTASFLADYFQVLPEA